MVCEPSERISTTLSSFNTTFKRQKHKTTEWSSPQGCVRFSGVFGEAGLGNPEIRGGKTPKQELMSIMVLGKNKTQIKSLWIS